MGVRFAVCVLITIVGCVQPTFTKCPDVDCPASMVCDGQGGCALPTQLAQCNGQDDGSSCSYVDIKNSTVDGACSRSICLPIGCGNSIVTPNEICDDGNTVNGDGCSADCQSDETCGNTAVDPSRGEQCDDGNALDGDGCQHDCKNPRCGDGIKDDNLNELCDAGDAASMAPDAACRPNCQLPRCGDGVTDPGLSEVCDDGNNAADDGCSGDCKSDETCGNGVVDVLAGEVCDDHNTSSNDGCSGDCLSTEACGNNVIDTARGEVCDDGGTVNGDGCSSDCKSLETCGNGILDTIEEQCDLGTGTNSNLPNAMCRVDCKFPSCGDGVFDSLMNEQCDNGTMNGNTADKCRTNCQLPRCGDTIKDMAEACDDGNFNSGDMCSGDCKSNETCGNSYVDTVKGEQCDLGGANSNAMNAACRLDCKLPKCGDGVVDSTLGETCDLGALNSNAANATCRLNCQPQRCGDGVFDNTKGEVCDDGNVVSGDNCSADCKSNETCGNGIIDAVDGEQCDAGGLNSNLANAPCRTSCLLPKCGDSAVDTNLGEACDLGGSNSNAANANCRLNCQPQRCGDSITDSTKGEVCDDGNSVAGDNCSPDCKSLEVCGNGIVDLIDGEQCDAAGMNSNLANAPCRTDCKLPRCGDGAVDTTRGEACDLAGANSNNPNATCRLNCQPQRCGDGVFDNTKGEVCDDGNVMSGDNCSNDCKSLEVCGNSIVDTIDGEQCDDGNGTNNDFCHNNCTLPRCGDAIVDFNEQCDLGTAMNSNNPNAACRPTCTSRRCGDNVTDNLSGEVCDDGNLAFADGCTPDCASNESCGNNVIDVTVGELCDDGNTRGRDGCSRCKPEDAVLLTPGITLGTMTNITMAYDAARKKVVMYNYGTTYEWDGASWTEMHPRRNPQQRYGNGLAYDPIRKRVILFGGIYNNFFGDTWEWDGNDWTEIITTTAPSSRYYTKMAWDGNRNKIVLYGGFVSTGVSNETWEFDGANWQMITTVGNPGQRCGHGMAFDAIRKEMVVYGGNCSGTQLWVFNGAANPPTWASRGTFTPEVNYSPYMVYDASRGAIVMWTKPGTTHEWNGTAWVANTTDATPTPGTTYGANRYGAVAYDAARKQVVIAGGYTCPTSGSCVFLNQTWVRTGTVWSSPVWTRPPARVRAATAYDPVRGKVVMFGGNSEQCTYCGTMPNMTASTWEWDGRRWTENLASGAPSIRGGAWADFNTATKSIMVFGGMSDDGTTRSLYADLYSFNGSWSVPLNSGGRAGQLNPAMAYDAANNKVVTFGGSDIDNAHLDTTWTWTTAGWVGPLTPTTRPPARRTHAMAYDPLRRKVVMFGGQNDQYQNVGDVWEYDGMTGAWTQFNQSGPFARRGHALYFNPDLGQTNLYGNNTQGTFTEDLWEWNGTKWTQRPIDNPPGANYRAAIAYDSARHETIVFGGRNEWDTMRLLRYRPHTSLEACTFATVDYDKDGLAGCNDSDCWSVCTPLCPPGSASGCATSTSPRCGNGTCEALEDCDICPGDCTAGCTTNQCGDFRCNGTETRSTCPHDCP